MSSTLVAITVLGTVLVLGTGAQAGPVSAHTITGASGRSCGDWIYVPLCGGDSEVLEIHAVEGLGGTAIYRPPHPDQDPVRLTVTCMSFSSSFGRALSSAVFRPGRGPTDELGTLGHIGLSGHVFRGSGVSEDGRTYHFVVVDALYSSYDYYYVSQARQSGDCGTGNYVVETDPGAFDIIHAGNLAPHPKLAYSCEGRTCTFDGTLSSDLDGYVASYAWQFLEGEESLYFLGKGSGSTTTFTYPDTYGSPLWVYLQVTDDSGDSMGALRKISAY